MLFKTKVQNRSFLSKCEKLRRALSNVDAVIIGAGAGLSTAAGFEYSGERFEKYFSKYKEKYGFTDMYAGGFYRYETPEKFWAYWAKYIMCNRYTDAPKDVYDKLLRLVSEKDYFVITTNVDHCFQKAGFDKKRLFYTQGDYGLFQCSVPCCSKTYDNEEIIRKMLSSERDMKIPSELIPKCPVCGRPMSMNLRADDTFVQDEGWNKAAERYSLFIQRHKNMKLLLLELGVGFNTPAIIKYPFWQLAARNPNAVYVCINYGEAYAPPELDSRAICIGDDICRVLAEIVE